MDLSQVAKKVKNHKYRGRQEFIRDLELIVENSVKYNGQDSSFTQKAHTLVQVEQDSLGTSLGPDDENSYAFEGEGGVLEGEYEDEEEDLEGGAPNQPSKRPRMDADADEQQHRNVLEEDLEFSEEEDETARALGGMMTAEAADAAAMLTHEAQGAAEAMVQLANAAAAAGGYEEY